MLKFGLGPFGENDVRGLKDILQNLNLPFWLNFHPKGRVELPILGERRKQCGFVQGKTRGSEA